MGLSDPSSSSHDDKDDDGAEMEVEVEGDNVELLLGTLRERLKGFMETKTRDHHFVADGAAEGQAEIDVRIRYVARYRDGQRRVLEEAVKALEEMLPASGDGEER